MAKATGVEGQQVKSARGSQRSVPQTAADAGQAATQAGASAADASADSAAGLLQAHADFVAWWYQPHGAVLDAQMANLDANGVKREFVGYGAIGLIVLLFFTRMAPLVGNLVCIAYPILATLAVLRQQSNDANRLLAYWIVFGVLSIGDFRCGHLTIYWILKVTACTFLYLPQTQGALLVYGMVIEPVANFVDANVIKKLA